MRPVRLAIWLATAFFVVMLFLPLVREMLERLSVSNSSNLP
jgi:preprotein translocase subunit SecG